MTVRASRLTARPDTAHRPQVTGRNDTAWWRGAAIYQIYPRSFLDTSGNGIGDLDGIQERLAYVADLGVDAVWISPFFVSPMKDFGYDVADFCAVDPVFGSLADFDALLAEAHRLGLKVLIDQIYSHTSDQHAWFTESRGDRGNAKADWYVWADPTPGGGPPNNWQSFFFGPAWSWDARRGQYYLHNFLPQQPDLNLWNADVRAALLETLRFWLDRGVDGVRLDAISHLVHDKRLRDNPPRDHPAPRRPADLQDPVFLVGRPEAAEFLGELRAVLDGYEGRVAMGEIGGADVLAQAVHYADPEHTLQTYYAFGFLFEPALTPQLVKRVTEEALARHPRGWPTQCFSNHDAARVATRWGADNPERAQMLAVLLLCLRGSVCLYQGEELGLPQGEVPFERLTDPEAIRNWPRTLGRDGARTPMPWQAAAPHAGFSVAEPWLPVDPRHRALAVDAQSGVAGSTLETVRQALAGRRRHTALRCGDIRILEAAGERLVFERRDADETLICAFNFGATATAVEPTGGRLDPVADMPARGSVQADRIELPPHGYALARVVG